MRRVLAAAAILLAALLAQLTVVNGLPLPGGGTPDLVLLCVIAIGLIAGPRDGLAAGFLAGLALDLAPPASEVAGQYALVFCLTGYWCGRLSPVLRRSALLGLGAAACAAVLGEAAAACLTLVLDSPEVTSAAVAQMLPPELLYDLAFSPLVLFGAVRVAMALGVSFSPLDDSPALELGGSASPTGLASLPGLAGGAALAERGHGGARGRHARKRLGHGSASGGWLVGDAADEMTPAGAVGWLAGPARSRRARRRHARKLAALTGAMPRKGAVWVGSRPATLRLVVPPATATSAGLRRLRPGAGVAGSAAATARPGHVTSGGPAGIERHGVGQHGLNGPGVRRISFSGRSGGSGGPVGLPGSGPAGRGVPKIAFGSGGPGGLRRPGPAARRVPKIAFGSGGPDRRPGSGPAGRGVPKIAFGSGRLRGVGGAASARRGQGEPAGASGLPGAGLPSARSVPRIAFGSAGSAGLGGLGGLLGVGRFPGAGPPSARSVPRIAFGTGTWPGITRTNPGRPAVPRFGVAAAGHGRSASGAWLAAGGAKGARAAGHGWPRAGGGGARRRKEPRFRSGSAESAAWRPRPARTAKTARMRGGLGPARWLSWWRRPGDRSAVWRIGSRRMRELR